MPQDACSWTDFAVAAPALAHRARGLLDEFGFVFVGTLRRDGFPRICPVEAHLVRGGLMMALIAGSQKAADLERDPRLTIQTPITRVDRPGPELKLRGTALPVGDAQRQATADAIENRSGWRPRGTWRFIEIGIRAAALLTWTDEGDMLLSRWDTTRGLRETERRRLDFESSRYRRAADDS
jgi:hypothetical protein